MADRHGACQSSRRQQYGQTRDTAGYPAPATLRAMSPERDPLTVFAQLAADLGPALIPVGHRELLHSITETARRLFTARACSVALLTESDDELEFIMASGEGAEAVRELRIPAGQGIAGWVVMSGQAIAVDDVGADPRFAASVAETTGYVPRSILAMPLQTDRRVLGVIEVLDRSDRSAAGLGDMELLALFAGQAALVIESSAMFGELGRVLLEVACCRGQRRRRRCATSTATRPRRPSHARTWARSPRCSRSWAAPAPGSAASRCGYCATFWRTSGIESPSEPARMVGAIRH